MSANEKPGANGNGAAAARDHGSREDLGAKGDAPSLDRVLASVLREVQIVMERGEKLSSPTILGIMQVLLAYDKHVPKDAQTAAPKKLLDSFKLFENIEESRDIDQRNLKGVQVVKSSKSINKTKGDITAANGFEPLLEYVMSEWAHHCEHVGDPTSQGTIAYLQKFVEFVKGHEFEQAGKEVIKTYTLTQYPRMSWVLDRASQSGVNTEDNELMCRLIMCNVVNHHRGPYGERGGNKKRKNGHA